MEPVKPCDFKKNINVFPVFCKGFESKVPRIIFKPKTEEVMGGWRINYQEMLLFVLRYCEDDHVQGMQHDGRDEKSIQISVKNLEIRYNFGNVKLDHSEIS